MDYLESQIAADIQYLKKYFQKWKEYKYDGNVMPVTRGTMVEACFKWMISSFGKPHPIVSELSLYFDEYDPHHLWARSETGLREKLHLPVKNFPLFTHALALYDAHRLQTVFLAWKRAAVLGKKLDRHARRKRMERALSKWQRSARRRLWLEVQHDRVHMMRNRRCARKALVSWHIVYRTCVFYRLRTANRARFNAMLSLRINMYSRESQRLFIMNAIKHHHRKQQLLAYSTWISQLNRVSASPTFQDLTVLTSILVEAASASYQRSIHYHMVMFDLEGRSLYYQQHPLIRNIARLKPPVVVGEASFHTPQKKSRPVTRSESPPRSSLRKSGGGSERRRQSVSPTDSELDLFTPSALFRSPGSPYSLGGLAQDTYSPIGVYQTPPAASRNTPRSGGRSVGGSQAKRRVTIGSAPPSTPPRPRSPASADRSRGSAHKKYNTDVMNNNIFRSLMELVHTNLRSRKAQQLLCKTADRFARLRALLFSLRKWQHRVVQDRLDSMDTNTTALFGPDRVRNSSNGRIRFTDLDGDSHLYFKATSHLFKRWLQRTRRSAFLHSREDYVCYRSRLVTKLRLFGVWMIVAAKEERLRRLSNRVSINRLSQTLHLAFYAWSTLYSRTMLIKSNLREAVVRRNNEVRAFMAEKTQKDAVRSQGEVLRFWSLHIRHARKGRALLAIWKRTGGKLVARDAFERWKMILGLDLIVTCFKKHWLGYKARKLTHFREYSYLRWFRPQVRKYLHHRTQHCKRVVLDVLKLFIAGLRRQRQTDMDRVRLRRAVGLLKRFKSKRKAFKRSAGRGGAGFAMIFKRAYLRALRAFRVNQVEYRLVERTQNLRVKLIGLVRLKTYAQFSRHYFVCALRNNRRRLAAAMVQFRQWQREVCRRHLANRLRLRTYRLRRYLGKLIEFNQRRQDVYSFQQLQLRKKAHRMIAEWRGRTDVAIHFELVARAQWARHRKRRTLYRWFNLAHRNKYGQKLHTSHFHIMARERALKKLTNKHLLAMFMRVHSLLRSFRRQRLQVRRGHRKGQLRKMRLAFLQFYYCWKRKHPLEHMGLVSLVIHPDKLKNKREDHFIKRGGGGGGDSPSDHYLSSSRGGAALSRSMLEDSDEDEFDPGRGGKRLKSHTGNDLATATRVILRNARSSIRRGLISARGQERMTVNLQRTHSQNLFGRFLTQWVALYRYSKHIKAVSAHNLRESVRFIMRKCLLRLYKNIIAKKRRRHELGQERRANNRRAVRKHFNIFRCFYLEKVQERRLLRNVERYREQEAERRFLTLLKVSRAYFVKHHLFRYVRRMKQHGCVFFSRLRYYVARRRKSPASFALYKQYLKWVRRSFRRLKYFTRLHSDTTLIKLSCGEHFGRYHQRRTLRYWHRYARLRRRMTRCRRRFHLVPSLKTWYLAACDSLRAAHAVRVMSRKIHKRIKKSALFLWKLFTVRESRLRIQGEIVTRGIRHKVMSNVLYTMMRVIDNRQSVSKYERTRALHARYIKKRAFFFWHKHYLFNYMCAWKSARVHFHNWQHNAYWLRRQALHCRDAVTYCYRRAARHLLIRWVIATRKLRQRRMKAIVKHRMPAKKFLRWFRRWQYRMRVSKYWGFRGRGRNPSKVVREFNKGRLFDKWLRITRSRRVLRRIRRMRKTLLAWRKVARTLKFARQAFEGRLVLCGRSIFQRYYFNALVDNVAKLKAGRALQHFTEMVSKSKVFTWWRRAYKHRWESKMKVVRAMNGVVKVQVAHLFQVWKIKCRYAYKVNRVQLAKYVWARWRRIYLARVQWRVFRMRLIFGRWKAAMEGMDAQKRLLLLQRRRMFALTTRKMRVELLWVTIAFRRWHTSDASLHLREYRRHVHLLPEDASAGGKGKRKARAPPAAEGEEEGPPDEDRLTASDLYGHLAHSQAGRALCSQDLRVSRVRQGASARLQSIQGHLAQKLLHYDTTPHHPPAPPANENRRPPQHNQSSLRRGTAPPDRSVLETPVRAPHSSYIPASLISPVSAAKPRAAMHVRELM